MIKQLMPEIALIIYAISLASCGQSTVSEVKENPTPTNTSVQVKPTENSQLSKTTQRVQVTSQQSEPVAPLPPKSSKQPEVGIVKSMTSGDLMCYVTLLDENNVEQIVGADFRLCNNQKFFLDRKVRLTYELVAVNDCQSSEPCGKTRKQSLITKVELVKSDATKPTGKSYAISNGEWTVVVGNTESWSGVNYTGNLTYHGCDAKGNCLDLTGGKVSCRNGICTTGWQNGDYSYVLESPMDNPDRPQDTSATLIVRQGSKVILNATGLKPVSP